MSILNLAAQGACVPSTYTKYLHVLFSFGGADSWTSGRHREVRILVESRWSRRVFHVVWSLSCEDWTRHVNLVIIECVVQSESCL